MLAVRAPAASYMCNIIKTQTQLMRAESIEFVLMSEFSALLSTTFSMIIIAIVEYE